MKRYWVRPAARVLVGVMAVIALANSPALGSTERWTPLQSSPLARTEVSAAAVGRYVYVVGGYTTGSTPTRKVERYDTRRDRWRLVAPMPIAVNHAAAVSYGGDLYVVGGYTGTPFSLGIGTGGAAEATRRFFRYEPETDEWSSLPSAPTARAASAAAVIGDKLYVAGGADSLRPLTSFEIFDFRRRRWTTGPDLPLATEHTAGAALGGSFYVIAGRPFYGGGTNRFVQRYLPRERRWERAASLREGRAGFAAVTACGSIVVYGGEDPNEPPSGTIAEVERYDPGRGAWRPLPDMRTPRHGLGGAARGGRLYALEGGAVTLLTISNIAETLDLGCRDRSDGSLPEGDGRPPVPGAGHGSPRGAEGGSQRRDSGERPPDERRTAPKRDRSTQGGDGRVRPAAAAGEERVEESPAVLPFSGWSLLGVVLVGVMGVGVGAALLRVLRR